MKLIDQSEHVKYYEGFDINKLQNHPTDGSNGLMIVFFESLETEEKKYNRSKKISNILWSEKYTTFNKFINSFNNTYLALYETKGYTDVIFRGVKSKMETQGSTWSAVAGITY